MLFYGLTGNDLDMSKIFLEHFVSRNDTGNFSTLESNMERSCLGDHKKKINDNEANVEEMNRLALRNMHRKKMVEEIIK